MQRREFLKTTGAGCLAAAAWRQTESRAAESRLTALAVRRVESDRFVLEFSPSEPRPMRILQLTDTHFGDPDTDSKREDQRSFAEIRRLVAQQKPDFLVHTGDFINNDRGPDISFEAIDFFDDLGVPWTHALGNHDIGARSVPEFRKLMKHAAVGEFRDGDSDHYAFRFDVATPGKAQPVYSLVCFDSGFREPNRRVSRPQLDWFGRAMRGDAEQGIQAPCLAFIHIPVVEFEAMRAAGKSRGNFGEHVCFDNDRGDTFAELKKSNRVRAVFSGHDHKNDYTGLWNEVELVYGRVGGWSAYGDLPRGGRLIEIDLATGGYAHRLVFPAA